MAALIKGNLYKMIHDKGIMFIEILSIIIVIGISVFFVKNNTFVSRIAVVNCKYDLNINNDNVKVEKLDKEVPTSDLVKGRYDAEIVFRDNDKYEIKCVSGKDTKKNIDKILKNETADIKDESTRGVMANIIGFSTMLIPMIALMLFKYYFKEKKDIAARILCSNVSYFKYCISYVISSFIYVFIPFSLSTVVIFNITDVKTSMNFAKTSLLFALISFLGSSFALFIDTAIKSDDNASMSGNMIVMITALLSGAMFDISDNKIIDAVGKIFPEKYIVNAANLMDKGNSVSVYGLIYAALLSVIFIFLAVKLNRNRLEKGIA